MAVLFISFFPHSSISILYYCICGCMFDVLLFNFVNYVFLLLCVFHSVYSVSLCCSLYCLCVNMYCAAANGRHASCGQQLYHIIFICSTRLLKDGAQVPKHGAV